MLKHIHLASKFKIRSSSFNVFTAYLSGGFLLRFGGRGGWSDLLKLNERSLNEKYIPYGRVQLLIWYFLEGLSENVIFFCLSFKQKWRYLVNKLFENELCSSRPLSYLVPLWGRRDHELAKHRLWTIWACLRSFHCLGFTDDIISACLRFQP